MAINFPATGGQATDGSYTYTVAGIVYAWNGSSWEAAGAGASATDRTLFSVTTNAAGTPALSYSSSTGVFTYTPPQAESDTLQSVVDRGNAAVGSDIFIGDYAGATGAPKIHYIDSSHTLWFKCNGIGASSAKIELGNGISYNNLRIQTTSTQAEIVSYNTPLFISSQSAGSNITLQTADNIYLQVDSYDAIKVLENGVTNGDALSVELYWGSPTTGGKKLETTTNGVTITGALTAGGLTFPTTNGTANDVLTSDGSGGVTWTATAGLQSRQTANVTQSIANNTAANVSISTAKGFALYSIETSHAAWVTLYTDTTSRTNDASRLETTDPTPGSGVLAEVITTGAMVQMITPGTICFNSGSVATTYAKIVNKSGSTANIAVGLNFVPIEA